MVRGFAALGLANYRERLDGVVLDLTPASMEFEGGRVSIVVEVERTWSLDIDTVPTTDALYVRFVRAGGGWEIIDDDPLRRVGVTTTRLLWEISDISVVAEGRFVVVGDPSLQSRLEQVAELAATAHDRLISISAPDPLLIIVPTDADQAAAFLQTPLDLSKFVAFVSFTSDDTDGWTPGPPRMVLQEGNLRRRSTSSQIETLTHELAHAATLHLSGPLEPIWVHEGVAEWEALGHPSGPGGELSVPESHQFRTGAISNIVAAYNNAESLVARLGDLDPALPQQLFALIGAERRSAGTIEFHARQALARLGVDQAALEAGPLR